MLTNYQVYNFKAPGWHAQACKIKTFKSLAKIILQISTE